MKSLHEWYLTIKDKWEVTEYPECYLACLKKL